MYTLYDVLREVKRNVIEGCHYSCAETNDSTETVILENGNVIYAYQNHSGFASGILCSVEDFLQFPLASLQGKCDAIRYYNYIQEGVC